MTFFCLNIHWCKFQLKFTSKTRKQINNAICECKSGNLVQPWCTHTDVLTYSNTACLGRTAPNTARLPWPPTLTYLWDDHLCHQSICSFLLLYCCLASIAVFKVFSSFALYMYSICMCSDVIITALCIYLKLFKHFPLHCLPSYIVSSSSSLK